MMTRLYIPPCFFSFALPKEKKQKKRPPQSNRSIVKELLLQILLLFALGIEPLPELSRRCQFVISSEINWREASGESPARRERPN